MHQKLKASTADIHQGSICSCHRWHQKLVAAKMSTDSALAQPSLSHGSLARKRNEEESLPLNHTSGLPLVETQAQAARGGTQTSSQSCAWPGHPGPAAQAPHTSPSTTSSRAPKRHPTGFPLLVPPPALSPGSPAEQQAQGAGSKQADALHLLDPETMSTTTVMAKTHFHPENSSDSSPYPHQPRGASRGAPLLQNPLPVAAPGRLGRGWRRAQHLWLSNKINHYVLPPPAGTSPSSTSQGPAKQQHPFVALIRVLQRGPGGASAPQAEPGSGAAEWGTGRGKAGALCIPALQPWGEGRGFSPWSRKTAVLQTLIL